MWVNEQRGGGQSVRRVGSGTREVTRLFGRCDWVTEPGPIREPETEAKKEGVASHGKGEKRKMGVDRHGRF